MADYISAAKRGEQTAPSSGQHGQLHHVCCIFHIFYKYFWDIFHIFFNHISHNLQIFFGYFSQIFQTYFTYFTNIFVIFQNFSDIFYIFFTYFTYSWDIFHKFFRRILLIDQHVMLSQCAAVGPSVLCRVPSSVWTWSTSQSCCRSLDSPQTNNSR